MCIAFLLKKKNLLEHEKPWQNQIVSRKNKPTIETKKSDFQKQETVRTSVRTTLASILSSLTYPFPWAKWSYTEMSVEIVFPNFATSDYLIIMKSYFGSGDPICRLNKKCPLFWMQPCLTWLMKEVVRKSPGRYRSIKAFVDINLR